MFDNEIHDVIVIINEKLLEKVNELERERDEWRNCADALIDYTHEFVENLSNWGKGYNRYDREIEQAKDTIEVNNRLKNENKHT